MNPWIMILVFLSVKKVESVIDDGSDNSSSSDCIEKGGEGSVITAVVTMTENKVNRT